MKPQGKPINPDLVFPCLYPDYALHNGTLLYLGRTECLLPPPLYRFLSRCTGQESLRAIEEEINTKESTIPLILALESLGYLFLWHRDEEREITRHRKSVLVLSPHMDDAFLALSGTILKWWPVAEFHIQDVFGGDPWINDSRLELSSEEMIAFRKAEEHFNARICGCGLGIWDLPAALQRGYPSWDAPCDSRRDAALRKELEHLVYESASEMPCQYLLFPLGIGAHPDHLLLRQVAEDLFSRGRFQRLGIERIGFFEDQPYASYSTHWAAVESVTSGSVADLVPEYVDVSNFIEMKYALTRTYRSQLMPKDNIRIRRYSHRSHMRSGLDAIDGHAVDVPTEWNERIWWHSCPPEWNGYDDRRTSFRREKE